MNALIGAGIIYHGTFTIYAQIIGNGQVITTGTVTTIFGYVVHRIGTIIV